MTDTPIDIVVGYRPGIVGRCTEMQARYYARHHGFERDFETSRANDIADFFVRDAARNRFWSALVADTVVGTIAIDADRPEPNAAQLRWFIVDDSARGSGVGRRLLDAAVAYCDAEGFADTHLWTFAGLDAARTLYEQFGFALVDAATSTKYGPPILEQHFVRPGVA